MPICCCDRGASDDLIMACRSSIYLGEISRHGAGGGGGGASAAAAAVDAYSSAISKLQALTKCEFIRIKCCTLWVSILPASLKYVLFSVSSKQDSCFQTMDGAASDPLQKFVSALERTNPNRWEDFGFGSWILDCSFWSLDLGPTVYGLSNAAPNRALDLSSLHSLGIYTVHSKKKSKPCRLGLADSW